MMFFAVASAVIGGTALLGGSGTVVGAFLGALLLGIVFDGFNLTGVSANAFNVVLGSAILIAMILNVVAARGAKAPRIPGADMNGDAEVIRAEGIRKRFGPVSALADINLHVRRGEILGLIGDNGAGKSTLIKILTGYHQPDGGRLLFEGEPVRPEVGGARPVPGHRDGLPGPRDDRQPAGLPQPAPEQGAGAPAGAVPAAA